MVAFTHVGDGQIVPKPSQYTFVALANIGVGQVLPVDELWRSPFRDTFEVVKSVAVSSLYFRMRRAQEKAGLANGSTSESFDLAPRLLDSRIVVRKSKWRSRRNRTPARRRDTIFDGHRAVTPFQALWRVI
jgi:hypothetical protein